MTFEIVFLSVADVTKLHREGLNRWGGGEGLRSPGLLASAVAMPEQSWGGEYLHEDLFAMAAAYGFHIAENQPFVDGNKRAAAAAMLVFLELNGVSIECDADVLQTAMLEIAGGLLDKAGLADLLRGLVHAESGRLTWGSP